MFWNSWSAGFLGERLYGKFGGGVIILWDQAPVHALSCLGVMRPSLDGEPAWTWLSQTARVSPMFHRDWEQVFLTVHHYLRFRPRFSALSDRTTRQHEKACEPHNPDRDDDEGRGTCLEAAEDQSLSEHLPVLSGIICAPHLCERPRYVQRARHSAPTLPPSSDSARITGSCHTGRP